jgi:hypothetical protein
VGSGGLLPQNSFSYSSSQGVVVLRSLVQVVVAVPQVAVATLVTRLLLSSCSSSSSLAHPQGAGEASCSAVSLVCLRQMGMLQGGADLPRSSCSFSL